MTKPTELHRQQLLDGETLFLMVCPECETGDVRGKFVCLGCSGEREIWVDARSKSGKRYWKKYDPDTDYV